MSELSNEDLLVALMGRVLLHHVAFLRGDEAEHIATRDAMLDTKAAVLARMAPQWRPIETAPKNGTEVLLWDWIEQEMFSAQFQFGYWNNTQRGLSCDPFCWMPLPAPPNPSRPDDDQAPISQTKVME